MNGVLINVFNHRERLLAALRTGDDLAPLVRRMVSVSFMCALLYGAVLGMQMGGWQVVSSPVKLPLILLGTGVLCVGALYVLLALAVTRLRWLQVVGLALCSVSASAATMAALLPLTAFWTCVFPAGDRAVVTLTHSAAFVVAGAVGAGFGMEMAAALFQERRVRGAMLVWMWIYGLVAQQMAYLFRPFFHPTSVFMRPLGSGGSALEVWYRLLAEFLR